jgi:hypothetical protein
VAVASGSCFGCFGFGSSSGFAIDCVRRFCRRDAAGHDHLHRDHRAPSASCDRYGQVIRSCFDLKHYTVRNDEGKNELTYELRLSLSDELSLFFLSRCFFTVFLSAFFLRFSSLAKCRFSFSIFHSF